MRLTKLSYILSFFVLITTNLFSQPITNIIDLHENDAQGIPITIGDEYTITGIVTVPTDLFHDTYTQIYVQDETAGINVFSYDRPAFFNLGDSVTITGTLDQYNGATEIILSTATIHSSGHDLPSPRTLTCSQVSNAFQDDYSEPNEGRLIQIFNVTYQSGNDMVTDASGSCKLYKETEIDIPNGTFNITGILHQYDYTAPYNDYYEIIPRFQSDISFSDVRFTAPPIESEIQSNSVTINWSTDVATTAILYYGETPNYEIDTLTISSPAVFQSYSLTELNPATIYHYQVKVQDNGNTMSSGDRLFCTASRPESTGKMRIYFSKSVDQSYATEKNAAGNVNILSKFIQRVNSAKYSVDACFYNITADEAAEVLIGAQLRGCRVRVIADARHRDSEALQLIENSDVPIIYDDYGSNSGYAAMHNKFLVIDHLDTTSAADDWVWLGSYNATYSASYYNAENVIEIQDEALAKCYTIEFNEMWGSNTVTPDPSRSRFGSRKSNNTPHLFNINGIEVRQYMSPSDGGGEYLINDILNAQSSLYFCMLIFTQDEIADALKDRWLSPPDIKIKGVFDRNSTVGNSSNKYHDMAGNGDDPWSPSADVLIDPNTRTLHHKYLIIDGDGMGQNPKLVTGSYNWSWSAENRNDENFVIINDATIANLYLQEFAERYHGAGGTDDLIYTSVEKSFDNGVITNSELQQNYPNPFNSSTTINFYLHKKADAEITIFNLTGQEVHHYDMDNCQVGAHQVRWNGVDLQNKKVSAGVYFYKLHLKTETSKVYVRKMLYLP